MSTAELTESKPGRPGEFLDGVRHSVPVVLASVPFGLL